ncbi:hypothetical protein Q0M94_28110 (plasmid) [Deinococcus radiomollis]|uniref:hypothetical protein n=1 Tax=Deinococcus radiomollis TaxID=468916 RepID=UPI003891A0D5
MSRGPGTIQRAALEALQLSATMLDSITVACQVYGHNPVSEAEVVSVRRALRSLAKRGQVADMGHGWRSGRRMWALPERGAAYQVRVQQAFGS